MKDQAKSYRDAVVCMKALETAGFLARLAGGCVRDRKLGLTPHDFDIATQATPDDICRVLTHPHRKLVPTGVDYGTITVVMPSGPIEVTSLRRDVETFGRRARVVFGTSFEEDAARRDFTINAMFEDCDGTVYDYFDGLSDLKAGVLRFVGEARLRIQEDYLRILRLFRFWARLGFTPDDAALQAVAENAPGLRAVSQERITSELMMILASERLLQVLPRLTDTGVLPVILGNWFNLNPLIMAVPSTIGRELAAAFQLIQLINVGSDDLKAFGRDLRLSNQTVRNLEAILLPESAWPGENAGDRMAFLDQAEGLIAPHRLSELFALWTLRYPKHDSKSLEAFELASRRLRLSKLPVDGHDLARVFSGIPGKELGDRLRELLVAYRCGAFATRDEALAYAKRRWE